ncbi:MAG: alpha/beta fold hydrolase [Sedimentitalea sp.]
MNLVRDGQGEVLVLLHGYLGGAAMWDAQVAAFRDRFDVIVPELDGFGGRTDLTASASITDSAQRVLDLLGGLGILRFHLVGHSMGGMIAQEMAALAPTRIDRLICYGTGPRGVMPDRFETLDMSRQRLRTEGVRATARRIAATWFAQGEAAEGFDLCAGLGEHVSEASALAGLAAMEGWDGRDGLAGIIQPTLVLWGDLDKSYGWAQPEALWRGISGASLGVLPGCGHNAHLEKPDIFNALLESFLPDPI